MSESRMSPTRRALQADLPPGHTLKVRRKLENRLWQQRRYLQTLAKTGAQGLSLKAAKASFEQLRGWRAGVLADAGVAEIADFATEETRAREAFAEGLEYVAVKRATEYSDQLLMFLLRGLKPEKYRDRVDLQVTPVIKAVGGFDPGDVL